MPSQQKTDLLTDPTRSLVLAGSTRKGKLTGAKVSGSKGAGANSKVKKRSDQRLRRRVSVVRLLQRNRAAVEEPSVPEDILNAPGGPVAALLQRHPGLFRVGRTLTENWAAFVAEASPKLAHVKAECPDSIRVTLPDAPSFKVARRCRNH